MAPPTEPGAGNGTSCLSLSARSTVATQVTATALPTKIGRAGDCHPIGGRIPGGDDEF
ncbi:MULTISPECIES: hypothetical protein [Methylobacterium]|uniref:hypothetical protein n=1 Tax=Methylobacterium TaxID=407 RepID=UPI0013EA1B76|nr:hypothetical protein [Methylobacterium sp. DB0501]NGM33175.1 hypothetical protein [Methylobacterium sp. DB0501]